MAAQLLMWLLFLLQRPVALCEDDSVFEEEDEKDARSPLLKVCIHSLISKPFFICVFRVSSPLCACRLPRPLLYLLCASSIQQTGAWRPACSSPLRSPCHGQSTWRPRRRLMVSASTAGPSLTLCHTVHRYTSIHLIQFQASILEFIVS